MLASAKQNTEIERKSMKYLRFSAQEKLITNDKTIIEIGNAIEIAYKMDLIISLDSIITNFQISIA